MTCSVKFTLGLLAAVSSLNVAAANLIRSGRSNAQEEWGAHGASRRHRVQKELRGLREKEQTIMSSAEKELSFIDAIALMDEEPLRELQGSMTEPPTPPVVTEPPTPAPVEVDPPVTDPPTPAPVETDPPTPAPVETDPPTPAPVETEPPTPAPVETEPPTPAPVETEPPTPAPVETDPPTPAPVETDPPTPAPVETDPPTPAPVETDEPTAAPVETDEPTAAPVAVTEVPTPLETEEPVAAPVAAPTGGTQSPVDENFDISQCTSYALDWLIDLQGSCQDFITLEGCECTQAQNLLDAGVIQCATEGDPSPPACPQDCEVCKTCLVLIGCQDIYG